MEHSIDVAGLKDRLLSAQVAGCTCMTKTPDIGHHDPKCSYRLFAEALEAIKHLEKSAGNPG